MSKPFDMELFLAGILKGANATRKRHIQQAKTIQAAIHERWQLDNPWSWQRKHLVWFLDSHIQSRSGSTCYYYLLTIGLISSRLRKSWTFQRQADAKNR
ncbi:hypothetical protein [Pseudomonas sp. R4-35-07]|uniref:hypothetical protein n=1 Tax=Pseudomonas sp. R4-35-07 TaxID=658643 RepID=UPI000F5722B4|nr:hypothetical protein [Pseudomonas sp. R4-35-07]